MSRVAGNKGVLRAGTEPDRTTGDWLIVDMGFAEKRKSCGILSAADDRYKNGASVTFAAVATYLSELAKTSGQPVNLVLEAPMSMAFNAEGNPTGRTFEQKAGHAPRYWYLGAGASVLLASLFLLRRVCTVPPRREIRLFEGFVSFKLKGSKSDHIADARALHNAAVRGDGIRYNEDEIVQAGQQLESILRQINGAAGIPPVIIAQPPEA